MERRVAVRRWHRAVKKPPPPLPPPAQQQQQPQSSSSVVEEDRGSQCGVEQQRKIRDTTPVLVLESSDEEDEVKEVRDAANKEVVEDSSGDRQQQQEQQQEEDEEEEEDEEQGGGSSKRAKLDPIKTDDDDEILDPDENWEPPAAGAITTYVEPIADWELVSHKNVSSTGDLLSDVNPLQSLSLIDQEPISVQPLQEAAANACIAELADYDDDDEFPDTAIATFPPAAADGETDDARIVVVETLTTYETLRIRYLRDKQRSGGVGDHPHDCSMKAATSMKERHLWINQMSRIGPVPGVDVGDIFYFRAAMMIVGLHRQTQAGIAGIKPDRNQFGQLLAVSLVLSGGYEDDVDSGETFTYTGHGQNDHQKLERGNLALANSCRFDVPVRVIRGVKDRKSPSGTIYSYDGLYKVLSFWPETGSSGFRVYKYRLEREPGQPELGSRLVKFSGKLQAKQETRKSVVCEDISGGRERVPICAVNDVDPVPTPPPRFDYITETIFPPGFLQPSYPDGCRCRGSCGDWDECLCIRRNGGKMPYNDGALFEFQTIVYECGPMCRCPPSCPLRLSQQPPTRKLEVFKTADRGWGVRSWEAIPYGSFICEYVGELISNEDAEKRVGQDEYIFDIDCIKGSRIRGVDISGFFEEKVGGELCEVLDDGETEMSIDAGSSGNVSRFINHSCDPNIFVQCVFYDHNDLAYPHVMMFAMKNIAPFEELSYDYNYSVNSVKDQDGGIKKKRCYCGARKCRKRLY